MPERLVTELPGDPARFHLCYGHGHPAVPYDYEDTLEPWHVAVTYGIAATRSGKSKKGTGAVTPRQRTPRSGTSSCGVLSLISMSSGILIVMPCVRC
ncbi:hypothetical protein, partial [Streptomyces sp. SID4917]|uniref:hypothetical protein n=1 Tax=Streptomyces sp. SID4917 TaxID=2690269 RepID=UPI001F1E981D